MWATKSLLPIWLFWLKMQIDRIYYPVKTLGYGKRMGIWTIGCKRKCVNCSNPELWKENPGKDISTETITGIIEKYKDKADGVTITGGEPFLQPEELLSLVEKIREIGIDDILIYTGFSFEELYENPLTKKIIDLSGVIVDGEYIDELNNNVGMKGSENQRVFVVNKSLLEKYKDFSSVKRQSEIVNNGGKIMSIGIPLKK